MKTWHLLLCALPFVVLGLWIISGKNINSVLTFGVILACPLAHMLLMKHNGKGGDHHGKN
jgi:hypothetical protein